MIARKIPIPSSYRLESVTLDGKANSCANVHEANLPNNEASQSKTQSALLCERGNPEGAKRLLPLGTQKARSAYH